MVQRRWIKEGNLSIKLDQPQVRIMDLGVEEKMLLALSENLPHPFTTQASTQHVGFIHMVGLSCGMDLLCTVLSILSLRLVLRSLGEKWCLVECLY